MISKNKLKELSVYKQQKHCKEAGVFVVEGVKMCHEAMAAKAPVRVVCATKLWLEQHPNLPTNAEVYEVEQDSLSRLSHMTTPNEVWMLVERDLPPSPRGSPSS
jgi:tRNA G18 (ribose-2'-O)-methylase SpoU